jgi:hypothetical protein|tara:strand:- start:33 stop:497 length:465 start_codon:yes stop_codon:yes gene_type:complete
MQSRSWDRDKDYETLVKWWNQWEFGVVPKECLPPDGIVVEHDGVPVCAGGLYVCDGTAFGLMEWLVTDKDAKQRIVHNCLKQCIDEIIQLAKTKKLKLVYTATKEQALHKRYTKYHNMVLTESNLKAFIRDLDGAYTKDLTWISDDEQIDSRNK